MSMTSTYQNPTSTQIKESMSRATSIYQSILINEHIQETLINKIELMELLELMKSLSSEQLYEIVNSVFCYDSNQDKKERIKETSVGDTILKELVN